MSEAKTEPEATPIADEILVNKIYLIRGQKVMLDNDLAELYGVETKRLNERVRRNSSRSPIDFMFQLTEDEWKSLRSQIATSKDGRGGRTYSECVHRTWRTNAFQHIEQRTGRPSKHPDHANIHPDKANGGRLHQLAIRNRRNKK